MDWISKISLESLTTYIKSGSHLESFLFLTSLQKYPASATIIVKTLNFLTGVFIYLFLVQINEPFFVLIKKYKYPAQLTTLSIVLSPDLWNIQINKQVSFFENLHCYFVCVFINFLRTLEQTLDEPSLLKVLIFSFCSYRPWLPLYKFVTNFLGQSKVRDFHNSSRMYYFIEA